MIYSRFRLQFKQHMLSIIKKRIKKIILICDIKCTLIKFDDRCHSLNFFHRRQQHVGSRVYTMELPLPKRFFPLTMRYLSSYSPGPEQNNASTVLRQDEGKKKKTITLRRIMAAFPNLRESFPDKQACILRNIIFFLVHSKLFIVYE